MEARRAVRSSVVTRVLLVRSERLAGIDRGTSLRRTVEVPEIHRSALFDRHRKIRLSTRFEFLAAQGRLAGDEPKLVSEAPTVLVSQQLPRMHQMS
jgi:hypothetical protein